MNAEPIFRREPETGVDRPGIRGDVAETSTSDRHLFELENRCAALRAELTEVEAQLRELRIAADLCPRCGGAGRVSVRGGLYREVHQVPCKCQGS
ncbi:MAG: hypothetical protein K0Q72_3565 [Armatimonadetes bacterium]|jgi:hypothetical protein|nr:hypothetical protein [Armatimonadota bacterium]